MSLNPKKIVKPLRTDCTFDLEPGTKLRFKTHDEDEGAVVGYLRTNPAKTGGLMEVLVTDREDLTEEEKMKLKEKGGGILELYRVQPEEVLEMRVVEEAPKFVTKIKVQKLHRTFIIDTKEKFSVLLKVLKVVDKVGVNFHGIFVGRSGTVGWVTLFTDNTIYCVDTIDLPKRMHERDELWKQLNTHLFKNERILKVIYNSRPIADYLYHWHCISLRNVFDIQVAEFFIWSQWRTRSKLKACRGTATYKLLSDCIQIFLPDEVLPEELTLLKEFEKEDFTVRNPLMQRPSYEIEKKARKCVAIDAKYLLRLQEVMATRLVERYMCCVSKQMESMVLGNSGRMERVMNDPLSLPQEVLEDGILRQGKSVPAKYSGGELVENRKASKKKKKAAKVLQAFIPRQVQKDK